MEGGKEALLAAAVGSWIGVLLSFAPGMPWQVPACMVVIVEPVIYQVIMNTPFAWLEKQDSFNAEQRGELTGVINSALSVSQALIAVSLGPLSACFGGKLFTAFVAAAAVCLVALFRLILRRTCCKRLP